MKKLFLVSPLLFFVLYLSAQDQFSRVKIYADTKEMKSLAASGLPVDHGIFKAGVYVICELSSQELEIVREKGLKYEVLIPDVSKYYEEQNASFLGHMEDLKRASYTLSLTWPVPEGFELGPVGGFLTLDQMLAHLDSMAAQYPDLITPRYAMDQTTHNGRQMFWVKISDNPTVNEDEPEVLYTGMHHAREPIGMQLLIFYMYYLLENYNTDPDVQYIVDNFELYFIPIINVDGYVYNIQNNPNGGGMWRKNRRQNEDGSYGVDLNRNYGYEWGYDNGGSSPVTTSETYRGPSAFSEPEIQNVRDFCNAHEFKLAINYHSYANQTLYPWGYTYDLTEDEAVFAAFSNILTYTSGYEYGPSNTTIYPTNGGSDDWMYGEQDTKGLIYSWTTEVGDGAVGFWPPASQIIPLCQENMWENMMLPKLAGPWAEVTDLAPAILETTSGLLFFEIQRLGLVDSTTFTVSIEPLNDAIDSVSPPKEFSNLELLLSETSAFAYYLREGIQNGDAVDYLLSVNNGLMIFSDTIHKIYGTPIRIFEDSASNFQNWLSAQWNTTPYQSHSPASSIADSPLGQYGNYDYNIMWLNDSIDLSEASFAVLNFWAKWDIEAGYDYVQVFISDDNGLSWNPIAGKYTTPGTNFQAPGQPVYDGTQSTWVREEMNLQPYLGKQIKIRMTLKSDSYVVADGFYWDDMTVTIIDIATGINPPQMADYPEVILVPNPAYDQVTVRCSDKLAKAQFMVFSLSGGKFFEKTLQQTVKFDVSSWPTGMYIYNVVSGNASVASGKFIVK